MASVSADGGKRKKMRFKIYILIPLILLGVGILYQRVYAATNIVTKSQFNLEIIDELCFMHPYTKVTITVADGVLNATNSNLTMGTYEGMLSFTAMQNCKLNLAASTPTIKFLVNNTENSNPTIQNGKKYIIKWNYFEPQWMLPMMFILGMAGLTCLLGGPVYACILIRRGDYYHGFSEGIIITALGYALFYAWLVA